MSQTKKTGLMTILLFLLSMLFLGKPETAHMQSDVPIPEWILLSTTTNDLPLPSAGTDQTSTLILDIDKDSRNDFVIGIRRQPGPSLVWYRRESAGWTKYLIDNSVLPIEAGGAYHDIDRDGDLDVVMGADAAGNQVWWWENPYPTYEPNTGWTRRLIKNDGGPKHHDQIFGDFDGDGEAELVFWNQYGNKLILAEIPADPRTTQPWPYTPIYTWQGMEHEGLAQADIDGDGIVDIVGGGRWFKRNSNGTFTPNLIDDTQRFTRAAAGQLKAGGRPEVVMVCGDCVGPLTLYEWDGANWIGRKLLDVDVDHGHSLQIADINGDGHLDIFNAEMRLDGGNPDAKAWIFYGKGDGTFVTTEVATGYGNHETEIGDLDGDGDLDILGKPFNWETPRLDIWLNQGQGSCSVSLNQWQRHVIDETKPWRSLFVTAADLDGDLDQDIITGGWWYQNPGTPGGAWVRHTLGAPLNNMAAVYDFDGNGTVDVLGTGGKGAESNAAFVWARNDGAGNFTILNNIEPAKGNFLQGVAVDRYQPSNALQVALSWHDESVGIQMLTVPADPLQQPWKWRQISPTSQGEALTSGDLDRDGDVDLLLGTKWLRNDSTGATEAWQPFTIYPAGEVDRNRLADINRDGRLDAVVGYEAASVPGKLAWYEQPADASGQWIEHLIGTPVGPMSLDVRDLDGDGDWDLVVGEHNLANPANAALWVYENVDGKGNNWRNHLVYRGDEHHDGAQIVDMDGDGDYDIISIGWDHSRVLLYENRTVHCESPTPTATSTATTTATPVNTVTPTATTTASPPPATPAPTLTPTATPPVVPPTSCRNDGLLRLYTFREGSGAVVKDVMHPDEPLDLVISDPASVTWLPAGGLALNAPVQIRSQQPATLITTAAQRANAFSLEVWVAPALANPNTDSHIVTLAQDSANRNFTLGQGIGDESSSAHYFMQVRTDAATGGFSSLTTPGQMVTTTLTHLVYTHDGADHRRIYVNGIKVTDSQLAEALFDWDPTYHLALANGGTGDHPWLGNFYYVALYDCTLSATEVINHYRNGAFLWPNQLPHAAFEVTPLLSGKPNTVRVDAGQSMDLDGTIQRYEWQWGDGASGEGVIAEHTYAALGVYTVTLTVTDDQGATASSSKQIQTEETVMQLYFPVAGQ